MGFCRVCSAVTFIGIVVLAACSRQAPTAAPATKPETPNTTPDEVTRLDRAIRRAMAWMTTIDVHPIRLRKEKGMKGIKHMVEYLDFHYLVYKGSNDPEIKTTALERALKILRVTNEDAYHNLASVGTTRFKEDSMSYLRACWLAEQLGKHTSAYRREIKKVLRRIHAHLPTRGVDQRMGFALLFSQLGLPRPEREEDIYPESLIANRAPMAYYLSSPDRPYDLTHEIFAMTGCGTRPFRLPSKEDAWYAKEIVRHLLKYYILEKNVDLAAELLVNLVQLGEADSAIAKQAREFIFEEQNKDGSFGKYAREAVLMKRRNPRYDVRIGGNLHTTEVCIWALVEITSRN